MNVFFQILAAALVVFLIWQIVVYFKWRIAVVSFVRYKAADYPHSTPREHAKSLKFIENWIGRAVAGMSKEQRTKMLTEMAPIDHDAARLLFALMATRDALDKGEITKAEMVSRFRGELMLAAVKSKLS